MKTKLPLLILLSCVVAAFGDSAPNPKNKLPQVVVGTPPTVWQVAKAPGASIDVKWNFFHPCLTGFVIERRASKWVEFRPGAGHEFALTPITYIIPLDKVDYDGVGHYWFRDTDVKAEATYSYRVRAMCSDGPSAWSLAYPCGFMFPWP